MHDLVYIKMMKVTKFAKYLELGAGNNKEYSTITHKSVHNTIIYSNK